MVGFFFQNIKIDKYNEKCYNILHMSTVSDPEVCRVSLVGSERISLAAEFALTNFSQRTKSERAIEHPKRVADILADFTHTELGPLVYDAVALHDIAQSAINRDDLRRRNARLVLKSYRRMIVEEESELHGKHGDLVSWDYVSTILSNLDEVESVSEEYRQVPTGNPQLDSVLSATTNVPVPADLFAIEPNLHDPNRMLNLLEGVNLEAFLIKAAEALDNLRNPAPSDRTVLQDVFEAESFYAPCLELLGYKGFSMAIRSESAILRLQKLGKTEWISSAEELTGQLQERDTIGALVEAIFERVLPGKSIGEHAVNNVAEHGTVIGRSLIDLDEISLENIKAYWRLKSLGSLALKLLRFEGEMPADVLGITLVVDSDDDAMSVFEQTVCAVKRNGKVAERPAPSRHEAYSVQGKEDYLEKFRHLLASTGVLEQEVEFKEKNNGHEVAKVTFAFTHDGTDFAVPVELMVQTQCAYERSERGEAAHVAYKAGGDAMNADVLRAIRERRDKMSTQTLNGQSRKAGKQFRDLIQETIGHL